MALDAEHHLADAEHADLAMRAAPQHHAAGRQALHLILVRVLDADATSPPSACASIWWPKQMLQTPGGVKRYEILDVHMSSS